MLGVEMFLRAALVALSFLVFGVLPATADFEQPANVGGSWTGSCNTATSTRQGWVMTATCSVSDGRQQQTQLDLRTCGQPPLAGNQDGAIVCESGARHIPLAGDWSQHCLWDSFDGQTLKAICFDSPDGVLHSIDKPVANCVEPVIFFYGELGPTCNKKPDPLTVFMQAHPESLATFQAHPELVAQLAHDPVAMQQLTNDPSLLGSMAGANLSGPKSITTTPAVQVAAAPRASFSFDASQARPATATGTINVRSAPSGGKIGSLIAGTVVVASCQGSWCALEQGGFVSSKFLHFEAVQAATPIAETDDSFFDATPSASSPPAEPAETGTTGSFDGFWSTADDAATLILVQNGSRVRGSLQDANRKLQLVGEVEGTKLTFTFTSIDSDGTSSSGDGFFNLVDKGASVSGVTMHEGMILAAINASKTQ